MVLPKITSQIPCSTLSLSVPVEKIRSALPAATSTVAIILRIWLAPSGRAMSGFGFFILLTSMPRSVASGRMSLYAYSERVMAISAYNDYELLANIGDVNMTRYLQMGKHSSIDLMSRNNASEARFSQVGFSTNNSHFILDKFAGDGLN